MSGIYDRVANREAENDSPIPSLLLWACVYAVGRGVATAAQVAARLNANIDVPLRPEDVADLQTILTNATTGTATQRIDHMLRLQSVLIATESKLIQSEATFRAELGI